MKKFLALILAVLMIAGSVVSVAAFDDVSGKYADAINGLQGTGIVAGKTETTFGPDELVTRWQMALFMARSVSAVTDDAEWTEGANIFTDCTQYLGAIQYCYGKGIIKGVTATEFAPDANILFRDGIIMALRALGYEKEDEGREESAKKYNVTGANYWAPYYDRAIELGLLENLGNIAVDKALTRAETAQLIYNMIYTPVYMVDGNEREYTLYDVAFGKKHLSDVKNSKTAWIVETPNYFLGEESKLDTDAEEIRIAWEEIDNVDGTVYGYEYANISFEDLEAWGFDLANIDEYLGGTLEIINYTVEDDDDDEDNDNVDYAEFEYLANFKKAAPVVLTHADVDLSFDKNGDFKYAKIGTKTHYNDAEIDDKANTKKNNIKLFTQAVADKDLDDVEYTQIKFVDDDPKKVDLKDKFYDIKLYDVDGDKYYEYGIVNFYKMDRYEDATSKGVERFGAMKGLTGVEYVGETVAEDDTFIYTFDLATKTVTVKYIVEVSEGTIVAYYEDENDDNDLIGYVTIDDAEYEIIPGVVDCIDVAKNRVDVKIAEAEELRDDAAKFLGDTYEFYAFDGKLLSFGNKIKGADDKYLIVKDFTDFELYDHVAVDAIIDGKEENIKVNKIREPKDNGGVKIHKLYDYSYSKLADRLEEIFGIYKYSVDEDGYYTLTRAEFEYTVGDFIANIDKVTCSDDKCNHKDDYDKFFKDGALVCPVCKTVVTVDDDLNFKDGVIKNYKSTDDLQALYKNTEIIDRNAMLRVNNDTQIYLIDMGEKEVVEVEPKTSGEFYIETNKNTKFFADKIGYGKDGNVDVITWDHGIASVIYILATDITYSINPADYTMIFVQEEVEAKTVGSEKKFDLPDDDTDEENNPVYTKYEFEEKAYNLATLETVELAYFKYNEKSGRKRNDPLEAGVYLLDKYNRIVDFDLLEDIDRNNLNVLNVTGTGEYFGYIMADVKWSDIDLYNYDDIRITTAAKVTGFGTKIKGLKADGQYLFPFNTTTTNDNNKKSKLDSNIQTIEFMEITKTYDSKKKVDVYDTETYTAKKGENKHGLERYLEREQGDHEITVLIAGNRPEGATKDGVIKFMTEYTKIGTLKGIIIDDLRAKADVVFADDAKEVIVEKGDKIVLDDVAPYVEGKVFTGEWEIIGADFELGTTFKAGEEIKVTADLTIKAVYEDAPEEDTTVGDDTILA